jgi:ATP-dependent Clp protease adaptor protein ClpS
MPQAERTNPVIHPVSSALTEFESLYRVIIHNDDVTPMDFVVLILGRIFFISGETAVEIMLTAHFNGEAFVQSLAKSEAQNRIGRAQFAAGLEGYPLRFSLEPE